MRVVHTLWVHTLWVYTLWLHTLWVHTLWVHTLWVYTLWFYKQVSSLFFEQLLHTPERCYPFAQDPLLSYLLQARSGVFADLIHIPQDNTSN